MKDRQGAMLILLCFTVVLVFLNYWVNQVEFALIISSYSLLFGLAFMLKFKFGKVWQLKQWLWICLLIRGTLLFNMPGLSDDVYRFIWDGELIWQGLNPYLHLPDKIITDLLIQDLNFQQLFSLLNSQSYYSVYPPVAQLTFSLAGVFPISAIYVQVVVLKLILLGGEYVTMWSLIKLLRHLDKNPLKFLWYGLNPLVIVEVIGNLHYEGLMCAFLGLALWQTFDKTSGIKAATSLATGIATKLHAAFAGPYIWKYLYPKLGAWIFIPVFMVVIALWFIPFYNLTFLDKFSDSLDLYFRKFEFNASLYYLTRWVGYQIRGYNMISVIGPYLMFIPVGVAIILFFRQKSGNPIMCIHGILFTMTTYFLCTTTLHPWYIVTLVFLSVLGNYRFPLIWSFVVVWSYSHYKDGNIGEKWGWIAFEYLVLLGYIMYELMPVIGKSMVASKKDHLD